MGALSAQRDQIEIEIAHARVKIEERMGEITHSKAELKELKGIRNREKEDNIRLTKEKSQLEKVIHKVKHDIAQITKAEKTMDHTLGKYVQKLENSISENIVAIEDRRDSTKSIQENNKEELWRLKSAIKVCEDQVTKLTHRVRKKEVTDNDRNHKLSSRLRRISDYLNDEQDSNSDIHLGDYINCDF